MVEITCLHLLIWWTLRDMKTSRRIALAFVVGTALATLGGGGHYLVDLVAAFPFSLVVWSFCMGMHHCIIPDGCFL